MPFEENKHKKLYIRNDDGNYREIADIGEFDFGFTEDVESKGGKVEVRLNFFNEYMKWKAIAIEWKWRAIALIGMLAFVFVLLLGIVIEMAIVGLI